MYYFFGYLLATALFDQEAIKILQISAKKLKVSVTDKLTIKIAVLIIARLGGFLGRKNDGLPGMQVLWKGWRKLYERIEFMGELTYG